MLETADRTGDSSGGSVQKEPPQQEMFSANELLAGGAGLGVVGAATTLLAGAACPLCVVGAPALLAAGAVKKLRRRQASWRVETTR